MVSRQARTVCVLGILLSAAPMASAQLSDRPDGMIFIPDVPGQWRSLTERPEALGMHISTTPNPSACRHYQGLVRVNAADGTPYFLVTRSGNTPDLPICPDELCCDDSPNEARNGNLVVFRMGSRPKDGERMRSNRLKKGVHVDDTVPPAEDVAVAYYTTVDGIDGGLVFRGDDDPLLPRVYQHPGGMQVIGHMMAMACEGARPYPNGCTSCFLLEDPPPACDVCFNYERASSPTMVMFFDVSDPVHPRYTSEFAPKDKDNHPLSGTDAMAITPLKNGRYLMAITTALDGDGPVYFYRSLPLGDCSNPAVDCTLANPNLNWQFVDQSLIPGRDEDDDAHQALHFFREGNIEGDLYLSGSRGHAEIGALFEDRDRIDLYKVDSFTPGEFVPGESVVMTVRYNGRRITPRPSTGGALLASLAAAAGFYESPSGEIIMYATEHDNDGPSGTLRAGEWRHIDMVRPDSPTLLPTAAVNGPYEVDEGSSVSLSGRAAPPLTRPWIELFHQTNYGGTDFSTFYPVVDYDDYALDDFENFFLLEYQIISGTPPTLFTHNDKAQSWKWFAPVGCSIQAQDYDEGELDETKTLAGTGFIEQDPALSLVLNDAGAVNISQEIDLVDFLANCDTYYATPVTLQWDLDGNGSFESSGSPVTFDASDLDGPDTVDVPAQAQHPAGGTPGTATAVVNIKNVPPSVGPLSLTDAGGNEVGVDVSFVLTGLPVTASADFTDPGLPDHQTAVIDWGDGAADDQDAFDSFDEAFGDGTGSAAHAHAYATGGTFGIDLTVTDDDEGAGSAAATVEALTPEQAVEEIVDMLDDLLQLPFGTKTLKYLQKARKALVGNPEGSNGALLKIQNGQTAAAIAFLNEAITALQSAQAGGAATGRLIVLLQQVVAALGA